MKYRKKPVVVEAVQWNGNIQTIIDFVGSKAVFYGDGNPCGVVISTLEGDVEASFGDWIIKGVEGEFYPCKPSIFEATYEAAA